SALADRILPFMTKTLAAFLLSVCAWTEQNPCVTVKSNMIAGQTQACTVSARRRVDAITVPASPRSGSVLSQGVLQFTSKGDPPKSARVLEAATPPGPPPHPRPNSC